MTWQILSRGFILNQSQPLIGYSPFQRQMERIWILPNCEINKNSFACHCPNYGDQPSAIILLSSLFLPTKLAPFHFYHSSLTAIDEYIKLSTKTHTKLTCSSTYMENHFSLLYLFTCTQKHKIY